jgi:hypothetical protein
MIQALKRTCFGVLASSWLVGCVTFSMNSEYKGPPERPADLAKYYGDDRGFRDVKETVLRKGKRFDMIRYELATGAGPAKIDLYKRKTPSDSIVLVFPVLGGKNIFEDYFAQYFAKNGFDAAIIHRSNEFKKPENLDKLEELIKGNVIRDRIALDFFEKKFGKKRFGTFGISRGAINVAISAGVDPRLKYNVMVMGGTDMVGLFKNSKQNRIKKYIKFVSDNRNMSPDEFFDYLRKNVKTDPKNLAHYIDARDTLLILSGFDTTVPFKYGMRLREQIGKPKTIVLAADHYTSLLYTQFVPLLPPSRALGIFPFDYVESEALHFYQKSFKGESDWWKNLPFKVIQAPFNLIASLFVS